MIGSCFVFVIVILMVSTEDIDNYINKTKILVDSVYPTTPANVRPTSAVVAHLPGIPPGWLKSTTESSLEDNVTTTSFPNKLTDEFKNLTKINSTVELLNGSNIQQVTRPPLGLPEPIIAEQEPNKNNIFGWILENLGIGNQKPKPPPSSFSQSPVECKETCYCGETYKKTRIVGGQEAEVNEYPWVGYLKYKGRFYCGTSLINDRYSLTAAHCVNSFPKEHIVAVFLDHDRSTTFETTTFTRNIAAILKHKNYNMGGSYNNDIALLRFDVEVPLSGLIKPVCLPQLRESFTGKTGIVVGWGATKEHGAVSNVLMEVDVPIVSNTDCRSTRYGSKITDNMLCAGYPQGMKDSCQGDSGGPLHIVNGKNHSIVGIVSWGEGCAEAGYYGVYTRVNRYLSWIMANTKDACYC